MHASQDDTKNYRIRVELETQIEEEEEEQFLRTILKVKNFFPLFRVAYNLYFLLVGLRHLIAACTHTQHIVTDGLNVKISKSSHDDS